MPMFENPARGQSIGKSSSGTSSGGKTSAGTNFFPPSSGGREPFAEHDFLAHAVVIDWIGNGILILQPLPRDAVE